MNVLYTSQCLCGILEFRIKLLLKVQNSIKLKFFTRLYEWNAYLFFMHTFWGKFPYVYTCGLLKKTKTDQFTSYMVNILPTLFGTFDVSWSFLVNSVWVLSESSSGLPNFSRAIAIRVRALENENSGCSRPQHSFADGRVFDFEKPRSLENAFLSVWFAPIHQCKYGWY